MGRKRRVFSAKAKFGNKHSYLLKNKIAKEEVQTPVPAVEIKAESAPVIEAKEEPAAVEIKVEPPTIVKAKPKPTVKKDAVQPVLEEKPKKKPVRKKRTRTTRKKTTTKSKE